MIDYIVLAVIVLIVGLAAYYVYRAKKRGRCCIGCSESGCTCCEKNDGNAPCSGCHKGK
ncbi:MAG: FeoB-associated Cys-rich membrane protein [Clostridia bacterium]|nr:FeoB-associated Cys-rich membrane protein [Clostridia bacterium]